MLSSKVSICSGEANAFRTLHPEFIGSEALNKMLDDMIDNAIDNFDNPRKHVTYEDKMAHVDTWHSFIDWALYYSGIPGGKRAPPGTALSRFFFQVTTISKG